MSIKNNNTHNKTTAIKIPSSPPEMAISPTSKKLKLVQNKDTNLKIEAPESK